MILTYQTYKELKMSNKHFEVDAMSHRKAKNKALRNGMTLKAYLKKLINTDMTIVDRVIDQYADAKKLRITEDKLQTIIKDIIETNDLKPYRGVGDEYSSFGQLSEVLKSQGIGLSGSDAFNLCVELEITMS